jgi:hypothetical protein
MSQLQLMCATVDKQFMPAGGFLALLQRELAAALMLHDDVEGVDDACM